MNQQRSTFRRSQSNPDLDKSRSPFVHRHSSYADTKQQQRLSFSESQDGNSIQSHSQMSQPDPRAGKKPRSNKRSKSKKAPEGNAPIPAKSPKSFTRDRSIVVSEKNFDVKLPQEICVSAMPRTLDYMPKEDKNDPEAILFNMNGSKFGSLDLQAAEEEEPSEAETDGEASTVIDSPRLIMGSPGSRIRVALGATGKEFLVTIDEDDGYRTWQSKSWAGLPPNLEDKLREVGYVNQCTFAANGKAWFLSGSCAKTGKIRNWWNVECPKFNDALQNAVDRGLETRVVFGDMEQDQYIILLGPNGYSLGASLPNELLIVLDNIYRAETSIARIRGLGASGTFLVEEAVDDGDEEDDSSMVSSVVRSVYHAQGLSKHLQSALEAFVENQEDLHEVAIGINDSSWLVVRDDAWDGSIGLHDALATKLDEFYERHAERQQRTQERVSLCSQEKRLREQQMTLRMAEEHCFQQAKRAFPRCQKAPRVVDETLKQIRLAEASLKREYRVGRRKKYVFETNDASKKRTEKEDRITDLLGNGLKPGDYATVAGVSTQFGDMKIETIDQDTGIVRIRLPPAAIQRNRRKNGCSTASGIDSGSFHPNETIIPIHDVRRLTQLEPAIPLDDKLEFAQLVAAHDKYEAAVILHHAYSEHGSCACKGEYFGFSQKEPNLALWKVGNRVHVHGFASGTVIAPTKEYSKRCFIRVQYDDGTTYHVSPNQLRPIAPLVQKCRCSFLQRNGAFEDAGYRIRPQFELFSSVNDVTVPPFDSFHCPEKVDVRRLQRLVDNLQSDQKQRKSLLDDFFQRVANSSNNSSYEVCYHMLEQCLDLEETLLSLFDILKGHPVDANGHIVHEVQYRHKDAAYRGRLFAVGYPVRLLETKFPRVLTLQSIQRNLLPPLCGEFCYYVDSENSDIRILCSLAVQLGLDTLIPTIIDYSKNRNKWIAAIRGQHPDATHIEVKRLVNVILFGGSYQHWLAQVDEEPVSKVRRFAFRLEAEVKTIRKQLLQHHRFQWTQIEKANQLKRRGGSVQEEKAKTILFQRILQASENEVLETIHRTFHSRGWKVRAKIFDAVLVERGPKAREEKISLDSMLRVVERSCASQGWDIQLVEKPLHGLEDQPIAAIEEARSILHAVQKAKGCDQENLDEIFDEVSRTSAATENSIQLF